MHEIHEVIIVGGGPAGLAAGIYCQRGALKTVLFEKGPPGGQIAISMDVENYPGIEGITGFDLAEKMLGHAKSFGLRIVQEEVVEVNAGRDLHSVRLANGDRHEAAALILGVGGTVRKLGVPGEADYLGRGVSYCGTCDGFFFKDRTVVVVGGGDTAVEETLHLSRLARKTLLVHRGGMLRAARILQGRLRADPGIVVMGNTFVREIRGNGEQVTAVVVQDSETGEQRELRTDGAFVFVGQVPNNTLVPPEVRMDEQGFVVTDEKCETTVPGIFAIGDLRRKYANQIVIAAADGSIAALAAAHYVEARSSRIIERGLIAGSGKR
ncbi:MAG: NAD(P)/FAD-dependent oxidoreductase [Nitrospirota bacterium]